MNNAKGKGKRKKAKYGKWRREKGEWNKLKRIKEKGKNGVSS